MKYIKKDPSPYAVTMKRLESDKDFIVLEYFKTENAAIKYMNKESKKNNYIYEVMQYV